MLKLGGVPLRSRDRDKPIVCAGGCANPLFVSDFVDFCFFGEIEANTSLADILSNAHVMGKDDLLREISNIDGVYVASRQKNKSIKRVYVKDLDSSYYPKKWAVPYVSIVHDRAYIEVARGCPNSCAFCQARCLYFPYRQRSPEVVLNLAHEIYKQTPKEYRFLLKEFVKPEIKG